MPNVDNLGAGKAQATNILTETLDQPANPTFLTDSHDVSSPGNTVTEYNQTVIADLPELAFYTEESSGNFNTFNEHHQHGFAYQTGYTSYDGGAVITQTQDTGMTNIANGELRVVILTHSVSVNDDTFSERTVLTSKDL